MWRTVDGNVPWTAFERLRDVPLDVVNAWFVASCETPDFVTSLERTSFLGETRVLRGMLTRSGTKTSPLCSTASWGWETAGDGGGGNVMTGAESSKSKGDDVVGMKRALPVT